jgi:transposase
MMAREETDFEAGFETGLATRPQRAVRMEVIPAGPARRDWPVETKARIIAESFAPGANVAEIARANDILPQQLYRWRHDSQNGRRLSFVPAVVDSPGGSTLFGDPSEIIVRAGAVTLHVPAGVTVEHIERVLLAARQAA